MNKSTNRIEISNFKFFYGENQVLFDINMKIPKNQVIALIGPSGCGKSTLLRSINRMNDLIEDISFQGEIKINEKNIFNPSIEIISLRKQVGMVFQKYNPFAKSIYENVIFSLRVAGKNKKQKLNEVVEKTLKRVSLWEEVKDKLHESAYNLSGGQMQRLCIARAIANKPQILLMDEPCAALDPTSTLKIEELIQTLKHTMTIVIVTHNLQQGARCSDKTGFMYQGKLIEFDDSKLIYSNPKEKLTKDYITGRFS